MLDSSLWRAFIQNSPQQHLHLLGFGLVNFVHGFPALVLFQLDASPTESCFLMWFVQTKIST